MCWGNCVSKIFWHCMQGKQTFLVAMATVVKKIFSQLKSKCFLPWYFLPRGLKHEIFFLEDFLLFAFPWQQGLKFGHIPTIFCGSVNFSFISIYWQIFKVVLFCLSKIFLPLASKRFVFPDCFSFFCLFWPPPVTFRH